MIFKLWHCFWQDTSEKVKKKQLNDLKWEHEVLGNRFSKVKSNIIKCTLDVSHILCARLGIYVWVSTFLHLFLHMHMCSCVRVTQLQLERDQLYEKFSQNIQKMQQKASVKSELLERQLDTLSDHLQKTQAQLSLVLSASNVDQTSLSGVTNKVEVLLYIPLL